MSISADAAGDEIPDRLPVRAGDRIWLGGHNADAKRHIAGHLAGTIRPADGPLDAAIITPLSPDEAAYFAAKLRSRLAPSARVFVVVAEAPRSECDVSGSSGALAEAMRPLALDQRRTLAIGGGSVALIFEVTGGHAPGGFQRAPSASAARTPPRPRTRSPASRTAAAPWT